MVKEETEFHNSFHYAVYQKRRNKVGVQKAMMQTEEFSLYRISHHFHRQQSFPDSDMR